MSSTARLEARISPDLHLILKRAAEVQVRTVTDFVVSAVQDAAQRAIEQAEIVRSLWPISVALRKRCLQRRN